MGRGTSAREPLGQPTRLITPGDTIRVVLFLDDLTLLKVKMPVRTSSQTD